MGGCRPFGLALAAAWPLVAGPTWGVTVAGRPSSSRGYPLRPRSGQSPPAAWPRALPMPVGAAPTCTSHAREQLCMLAKTPCTERAAGNRPLQPGHGRHPLVGWPLAVAVGCFHLRAPPCSLPPCGRRPASCPLMGVALRSTAALVGWPQPAVPAGAAPVGCCPCERPPLTGWPWPRPGHGWPTLHGAWPPLLLVAFAAKHSKNA
ncbi:hypothetical protein BHM03_00029860 [Ensete ventricosum]|nr:hypothetical protein BHM03_00029860 [Ensete ventricosum]